MKENDQDFWSSYFRSAIVEKHVPTNPPGTITILPMAGKGSRFADIGYSTPKPLLMINEKPMVIQAVSCIPRSDMNIFACLRQHIEDYKIGSILIDYFPNSKVYALDHVTEGQACTCELLIKAHDLTNDTPIQISACDNGVLYDGKKYQELVKDETNDVIVWTFKGHSSAINNPNAYAWLKVDDNDCIKHVSCKKFIYDDLATTHAIIGTMFFRKTKYFTDGLQQNYNNNIRTNGEFYVDDVLNRCIEQGLKVKVFEVDNYICWGTPEDYETYLNFQKIFHDIPDHPYRIELDTTGLNARKN